MNKKISFLIFFLSLFFSFSQIHAQTPPPSPPPLDHSVFTQLLKKFVNKKGHVDYRSFKRNKDALNTLGHYVEDLLQINAVNLISEADQKAYGINLYNALVLRDILKSYPVQSVMEIPHFFDGPRYELKGDEGKKLSLNDIEQFLREKFSDPSLHLMLVNGSSGGPRFMPEAFEAASLHKKMEEAMLNFLRDPSKNFYNFRANTFFASPIFLWFEDDFKNSQYLSAKNFIGARVPLPVGFRMGYSSYDWQLNDSKLH